MPVGTATLNFGAIGTFSPTASVAVTGQTAILSTSLVEAWLSPPGGTPDHTEDEHVVENMKIRVSAIIPGVGFTIDGEFIAPGVTGWGRWNIAWAWV